MTVEFVEQYRRRKSEEIIHVSSNCDWVPGKKRVLNAVMQIQYFDWILKSLDISYCVLEEKDIKRLFKTLEAIVPAFYLNIRKGREERGHAQAEMEMQRRVDPDDTNMSLDEIQTTAGQSRLTEGDSVDILDDEEPTKRRRIDYLEIVNELDALPGAEGIARRVILFYLRFFFVLNQ